MLKTFAKGGVHPPENKISAKSKIKDLPVPETVSIPISQHLGTPAKPVIEKGEQVKVGQLIAKHDGFVSSNIHSSVSGKIVKIDNLINSSGYKRKSIVIDTQGDEWDKNINNTDKLITNISYSPEEIINKVKDSIFGIDVNPLACILCQINLYFNLFELIKIIVENDNDYTIPIFSIFNNNAFQFNFNNKYDYVIGNPPYLFIRAIPRDHRIMIEKLPLETNKGQYDYYQIFIELGIKI